MKPSIFLPTELAAAWSLIIKAQAIALLTHTKPDGDGISACAALSSLLKKMGKHCETIYPTEADFAFSHEPQAIQINNHTFLPDLLIACDTANYERLYFPESFRVIDLINIDHHRANSITGVYNFVDPNASSTCEVLYELLLAWCPSLLSGWEANALLTGLLYDTQIFQTNSTTSKTLETAAQLIAQGASLIERKDELLKSKSPGIVLFWGALLSSVRFTQDQETAWLCITQKMLHEYQVTISSLIGFVNFLSSISSVDTTILLYETEDGYTKVSLRSRYKDVNKLAQGFGGGGHKNASGITSKKPIDELAQELIAALEK